jgi:hypothetical protein
MKLRGRQSHPTVASGVGTGSLRGPSAVRAWPEMRLRARQGRSTLASGVGRGAAWSQRRSAAGHGGAVSLDAVRMNVEVTAGLTT